MASSSTSYSSTATTNGSSSTQSQSTGKTQSTTNKVIDEKLRCVNPKCITAQEHYLPHQFIEFGGRTVCEFCEERALEV